MGHTALRLLLILAVASHVLAQVTAHKSTIGADRLAASAVVDP